MWKPRIKNAVVAVAVGLAVTGCGGSETKGDSPTSESTEGSGGDKTIDIGAVESKIETAQKERTPDLEVGEAACPDDVAPKRGASFVCTLDIAGVIAPYEVTVTETSGDDGRFDFKPAKPIISVAEAVGLVRSNVDPAAGEVDVECGNAAVKVLDVGETFTCTITQGTERQSVDLVVKDAEGTIAISSS